MNKYDGQPQSDPTKYNDVDKDYIRLRWDNRADRWDQDVADPYCHLNRRNSYQCFLDIAKASLGAMVANCSNKKIRLLDLGCGTGLVAESLAHLCSHITGIDISPRMISIASKRLPLGTELLTINMFDDFHYFCAFDAVVSRGVLLSHYGDRSLEFLSHIHNALLPGGVVIIDAINYQDPNRTTNKRAYGKLELSDILLSQGFCNVVIHGDITSPTLVVFATKA